MSTLRWAIVALLLLALARNVRAAPGEPIGDGRFGHVRVGWGGFVPKAGVAPVVILLANPDAREHVLRVAVSPRGSQRAEATVVLAPRGTGRASFVLSAPADLDVTLSEGGTLLASSTHATRLLPERAVLEVDGSPGTRKAPTLLDRAPPAFACEVEDLPAEAACYSPFQVVAFRLVDPAQIAPGALAALDDFVRAGGTVLVSGAGKHAGFFDRVAGPTEPGAVATKRHGLGRVSLVASDLGAITSAAEVDRSALVLPCAGATRHPFRPAPAEFAENEALKGLRLTYVIFLGGYALLVAPAIAFVLRRVRRRRLAWALVAGIVLALALAGAVVARSARSGTGRAAAASYVLVPARGDAVVLASAVFASGGNTRPDVTVEGDALSVTVVRPTCGESPVEETVVTSRQGGHGSLAFPAFPMPSFGEGYLSILASAPRVHAVLAHVERTSDGGRQLVVRNTTDRDLGPTYLIDWISCDDFSSASFPRVAAGETVVAPITSALSPVGHEYWQSRRSLERSGLQREILRDLDPAIGRYSLATVDPPSVRVHASNSDMQELSLRLQSVTDEDRPRGWIGAELGFSKEGELVIEHVAPRSPADLAGWKPGQRVFWFAYEEVTTPEQAAKILDAIGPGGDLYARVGGDLNSTSAVTVSVLAEPVSTRSRGPRPGPQ